MPSVSLVPGGDEASLVYVRNGPRTTRITFERNKTEEKRPVLSIGRTRTSKGQLSRLVRTLIRKGQLTGPVIGRTLIRKRQLPGLVIGRTLSPKEGRRSRSGRSGCRRTNIRPTNPRKNAV